MCFFFFFVRRVFFLFGFVFCNRLFFIVGFVFSKNVFKNKNICVFLLF